VPTRSKSRGMEKRLDFVMGESRGCGEFRMIAHTSTIVLFYPEITQEENQDAGLACRESVFSAGGAIHLSGATPVRSGLSMGAHGPKAGAGSSPLQCRRYQAASCG